jgi:hypothetical protein
VCWPWGAVVVSHVVVEADDVGKKSSSRKKSLMFVMKMKSIVAQSVPQKSYRLCPIQDHKRRGSRDLVSWPVVHAARRDGEELEGSTKL